MDIGELKSRTNRLEVVLIVGKGGLSTQVIGELMRQLRSKRLVKLRLLKNTKGDKPLKQVAQELAVQCNAQLVQRVGNTITLYKKP